MNHDKAEAFMHEWGDWAKWSDARAMVQEAYQRGLAAGFEQVKKIPVQSKIWLGSLNEA